MPATLALFVFPVLMAYAASSDLLTMKIANWLVLLLTAAYFVLALLAGLPLEQIGTSVAAAAIVFAIAFAFFAFGWIGGGDAKVAAAAGLWIGFGYLLDYLTFAAIAGGILTFVILLFRKWPLPSFLISQDWLTRLHDKNTGIPYGIALAVGALLIYPNTDWIKAVDLFQLAMQ